MLRMQQASTSRVVTSAQKLLFWQFVLESDATNPGIFRSAETAMILGFRISGLQSLLYSQKVTACWRVC